MISLPTVFCLHYLGGSTREWTRLEEELRGAIRIVPIDLPGFGDAAATTGYSVGEMADYVSQIVAMHAPERWILCGHSMGAKVAGIMARRAENGDATVAGLAGTILVAGSPPSPEPMKDEQRSKMLSWFRSDAETSRAQAHQYVASNSGPKLDAASRTLAEADVLRCSRDAWAAWLEHGSREDLSDRIGVVQLPALVIAGADDEQLGPDAQRRLTLPHYANASLVALPDAKHLLPMECTSELAGLFEEHVRFVAYRALTRSPRVSSGTRNALESRESPDDPKYAPAVLDAAALATLRVLAGRVVPQEGASHIDLAARIDKQLAENAGDGWRFAALPADAQAYRAGLETLDAIATERSGKPFAALEASECDTILRLVASGEAAPSASQPFDAGQLQLWFEDVRADVVKMYLAHPRTLARIGYSGVANGGDGMPKSGFARIGYGEREPWEPVSLADAKR